VHLSSDLSSAGQAGLMKGREPAREWGGVLGQKFLKENGDSSRVDFQILGPSPLGERRSNSQGVW